MKTILSAANAVIAIVFGVLVLLGYFLPKYKIISDLGGQLLQWAIFLAVFALLVGIANLVGVHFKKIATRQRGAAYSAVLLLALLLTLALVGLDLATTDGNGPAGFWSLWLFNSIQIPIEISLLALLAIVLALTAARLLGRRPNTFTVIFLLTVVVVLLGAAPLYLVGEVAPLSTLRNLATNLLAVGGARGLLLGVALGTIATGLRVLMGADRPYGG